MPEASLIFPAAEFEHRLERLHGFMGESQLGAMLLTSPADVFYITGFLTRFWESPARPWFVLVPLEREPVAVIPSIGAELMGRTWIRDVRTWDAPNPSDDGVSLLSDTIAELVPLDAQIGVPKGLETHLRMPLADFSRVAERIAPRIFVDGTSPIQRTREIKSDAEVAKIRATCEIAGQAFDDVPRFAGAGVPLKHIFRDFQIALLRNGADWVSYVAGAAGPDGYGDVISPADEVPMVAGDVLMLDTGAVCDGYFCDFDRNYAIGEASDDAKRAHVALWLATQTAIDTVRPGMRASDVHSILAKALTDQGFGEGAGRLGHGLGVTLTEWPSFTPLDHTELREGMVLTLEPSAILPSGCLQVHEENIVLRADGAELISPRAPNELPEIAQ